MRRLVVFLSVVAWVGCSVETEATAGESESSAAQLPGRPGAFPTDVTAVTSVVTYPPRGPNAPTFPEFACVTFNEKNKSLNQSNVWKVKLQGFPPDKGPIGSARAFDHWFPWESWGAFSQVSVTTDGNVHTYYGNIYYDTNDCPETERETMLPGKAPDRFPGAWAREVTSMVTKQGGLFACVVLDETAAKFRRHVWKVDAVDGQLPQKNVIQDSTELAPRSDYTPAAGSFRQTTEDSKSVTFTAVYDSRSCPETSREELPAD